MVDFSSFKTQCLEPLQCEAFWTRAAAHIMFIDKVDEVPEELNSCLYELAYGRIGFVILFCLKSQNLIMLGEDLLYSIYYFSLYHGTLMISFFALNLSESTIYLLYCLSPPLDSKLWQEKNDIWHLENVQ